MVICIPTCSTHKWQDCQRELIIIHRWKLQMWCYACIHDISKHGPRAIKGTYVGHSDSTTDVVEHERDDENEWQVINYVISISISISIKHHTWEGAPSKYSRWCRDLRECKCNLLMMHSDKKKKKRWWCIISREWSKACCTSYRPLWHRWHRWSCTYLIDGDSTEGWSDGEDEEPIQQ